MKPRVGATVGGEFEHARALVEAGDAAGKVLRQEAGTAGDVDRACRLECLERVDQRLALLLPVGPLAVGEEAGPSHQSSYSGARAS